ncbi:MAG: hypothetical protein Q9209_007866 [Squamulea sp. 1 TL-2023]
MTIAEREDTVVRRADMARNVVMAEVDTSVLRDEFDGAMHHARQHTSSSDPNESSLFSSALGMLSGNKQSFQDEDLDEDSAVRAHQQMYGGGGGGGRQHNSEDMGAGAAMQALKMFSGGEQGQQHQQGGGGQNAFIGMAMGQAAKLFDQQQEQGNVDPSTDKQSVVNNAAKMAFKMYMKSQMSGGGSSSGGPAGLLGMASKFMQ